MYLCGGAMPPYIGDEGGDITPPAAWPPDFFSSSRRRIISSALRVPPLHLSCGAYFLPSAVQSHCEEGNPNIKQSCRSRMFRHQIFLRALAFEQCQ